jgi:hypothetical protein
MGNGNKRFKGESLPFTANGWTRQFKSGQFRDGGAWKHVEKVKVVLASWDTDKGGNQTKDARKGQHFLSLMRGSQEIAFAIASKAAGGWRVLSFDCRGYYDVPTQSEAQGILSPLSWRRWQ